MDSIAKYIQLLKIESIEDVGDKNLKKKFREAAILTHPNTFVWEHQKLAATRKFIQVKEAFEHLAKMDIIERTQSVRKYLHAQAIPPKTPTKRSNLGPNSETTNSSTNSVRNFLEYFFLIISIPGCFYTMHLMIYPLYWQLLREFKLPKFDWEFGELTKWSEVLSGLLAAVIYIALLPLYLFHFAVVVLVFLGASIVPPVYLYREIISGNDDPLLITVSLQILLTVAFMLFLMIPRKILSSRIREELKLYK